MRWFLTGFAVLIVTVLAIAGVRGGKSRRPPIEIFPDMVRQAKLRPQQPNDVFSNGISSQLHVAGTIPHSQPLEVSGRPVEFNGQPVYAFQDLPLNTGRVTGATNFVELIPLPVTAQLMARGHERYQISCSPCHGAQGDGKGITTKYGMVAVANFHDPRLVKMADGEIFNTITHGKNLMGAYGDKVAVADRWAIIAYVRALQLSRLATTNDVPAELRAQLKK